MHCGDDGVKIWGTEIQIVSILARVRNIRMQSSKITYTIQDITGRMRAVLWIDQEAMEEDVSNKHHTILVADLLKIMKSFESYFPNNK